jgi:V-type H+-transporting ATPase subunit G
VKDARSEAQKEVEEYKKEKEDEYQKFEKEVRHRCPVARMP